MTHLDDVLEQLIALEPLFHRPEHGTTRAAFEAMTAEDFWEVGASGIRYDREFVWSVLAERYARQAADDAVDEWETSEFACRALGDDTVLLTYLLRQGARRTRRATIWERTPGGWQAVYHDTRGRDLAVRPLRRALRPLLDLLSEPRRPWCPRAQEYRQRSATTPSWPVTARTGDDRPERHRRVLPGTQEGRPRHGRPRALRRGRRRAQDVVRSAFGDRGHPWESEWSSARQALRGRARAGLDPDAASAPGFGRMTEPTTPAIDRTIYPMPMSATFQVADIAAAEAFYQLVGFISLATIPGPDGLPVLVHLRRMKYQDLLLVRGQPERGSTTVSFAAGGQDLVELATGLRSGAAPSARIEGPTDTLWFTSDLTIDDPDGNRVILTAPREAEMERAREWAREGIHGDFVVED